jgi:hypothetical protein
MSQFYYYTVGGLIRRRNEDGPYKGGELWVASMADRSPRYETGKPGNYNRDCSSCYLGHSHTVESHESSIKNYNR